MNVRNVKLIMSREVRDQMRDRRTLFMIFVLPVLLYPLLGMSFMQMSQFFRGQVSSVLVIGAKDLPTEPPLFGVNKRFHEGLFINPDKPEQLELHFATDEPLRSGPLGDDMQADVLRREARDAVKAGRYDVVLFFPEDFDEQLERFRQALGDRFRGASAKATIALEVPCPEIIYTTANERSHNAFGLLSDVLRRWTEEVGKANLMAGGVPSSAATPFAVKTADVSGKSGVVSTTLWAKLLPVLLLTWAMTGAFYPAVDLCAGEKERGTLETLLCSPAERSEIVMGKLLTIMIFSMITAALNVAALGLTGWLISNHIPNLGPPPPSAAIWLLIALVPISALFSALCLALAAFARSTKEGQYYLMPLLLITMPLAILPMAPGVELNLGNSLIPVTGVVLLLRSMLEGNYWQALQFSPIVIAVTLGCCLLSIRWAIDQFNSESVLFRESEQLDVGLWLRHLSRDRGPTPTLGMALFCAVFILVARFFMGLMASAPRDFADFAGQALVIQLALFALPAVLMAFMFTSSPRGTLLLKAPPWLAVAAAFLLAVVLNPVVLALGAGIQRLYPISAELEQQLLKIQEIVASAPLAWVILLLAVLPAICEELAFRGFILSGFRRVGHKWRAIIYSALFFGITHGMLQQSLSACVLGVVIGFLAVQSKSLLPCMVFHLVHNTLVVLFPRITPELIESWPALGMLLEPAGGGYTYTWQAVVAGALAGAALLVWFALLPCPRSVEEQLKKAVELGLAEDEEERSRGTQPPKPIDAGKPQPT